MSAVARLSVLSVCLILAVGCRGTFIDKDRYDQDVQTLKDYSAALERRNQELEGENAGLRRIADESKLFSTENEFYEQIARQIEQWLRGNQIDAADVSFDPKTGKWTMADDVLFDSGSYSISAKGREILKTFAAGYGDKNIRFRIAGHTDRDPVARDTTRKALPVTHTLNLELSALRAVSVSYELKKNGIVESRMFVEGHGNNQPIAPNDNRKENKKKNRRVEIYVLGGATQK